MTDLEQQLRAEFSRQADTAPDADTTEQFALSLVREQVAHRAYYRWPLAIAAALVLLVPTVTVLAVRHHHSQPATAMGVSTNPTDLFGIEWQLTSYTGKDGVTRDFTSGRVKTFGKFCQQYGRFEARIKELEPKPADKPKE